MRFRTRYIGPSLSTASGLGLGRTASMIRNRSRLASLNQLASHDYSATIDHNIGQFPLSDDVAGGSTIVIAGSGNLFMSTLYSPTYVCLGGMPVRLDLDTVDPADYTYGVFTAPSLVAYYTFLGLTPPTLTSGQSIDVSFSISNRYGFESGYVDSGETFQWIKP